LEAGPADAPAAGATPPGSSCRTWLRDP
jgi:hypothetical protein